MTETQFRLETHHFVWMVDAAIRHFEEKIEQGELSILRHEVFQDEPFPNALDHTRASRVESARKFLWEYREILRFLITLKKRASERTADEFARDFQAYLRAKKRARG